MNNCFVNDKAFHYARACVRVCVVAIGCAFLGACAAQKPAIVRPSTAVDAARFSDVGRIDRVEVRRVNPRNGASETLGLGPTDAFVRRMPGGVEKHLAVPKETLAGIAEQIREMGDVVVLPNRGQESLSMTLVVFSGRRERSVILDPEDKLHPVYDAFMKLREDVLKNGQ